MKQKLPLYYLLLFVAFTLNIALHSKWMSMEIHGVHSWRQIQTMLNVRNYYRYDANILNPRVNHFNNYESNIYRSEFPLMQWAIAMVMKITSEHLYVARLCVLVFWLWGFYGFYALLREINFQGWYAALGTSLLAFSPVVYNYLLAPIPDILAFSAVIWYTRYILRYARLSEGGALIKASIYLGLATLVKLQYLMFSVISIVFFAKAILARDKQWKELVRFVGIQFLFILPAAAWYSWVIPTWPKNPVLTGVFGDGFSWGAFSDLVWFHFSDMMPNTLLTPILVPFVVIGFFALQKFSSIAWWLFSLLFITLLYLLLEINAISTFHDYYLFPFLVWMYVIALVGIRVVGQKLPKYIPVLFLLVAVLAVKHTLSKNEFNWRVDSSGYNLNLYYHQEALVNAVPDTARCIIINDPSSLQMPYMIDKQGYVFNMDELPEAWIIDMITNKKTEYLYSDSRAVDTGFIMKPFLDSLILQAGNIKVFRLVELK